MKQNEIKKNLTETSKSIYHDYGKFAIEFEQLTLSIKICIFSLLKLQGLEDFKYLRILLHDQTASPLHQKLRSLLALHYEENPKRLKAVEKLFTHSKKIIEKRNDIIHGSFFVSSEEEEGNLFKDKAANTGVKQIDEIYDSEKFATYTTKVILTRQNFDILNSYLHEDDTVFDHFFNDEKLKELDIEKD
ncbi:hypothetical protein [Flavobacterium maritimum]|uniref:hypothetical protein n=1 Tax=Flavobacterium maritimum TaxID=3149042 RepID=UPI0032B3F22E